MTLNAGDQGCDLSNFNHPNGAAIDYAALAQAKKFAYVLISDGISFENTYALADVRGCLAAGMEVGGYQFFRPDENFDKQLSNFQKYYQAIGGFTLPPMIDCETASSQGMALTASLLGEFHTNMATVLGVDPGVYCNLDFYDNMPGCPWGWPFWLADPSHPDTPLEALPASTDRHRPGARRVGWRGPRRMAWPLGRSPPNHHKEMTT